MIIHMHDRVLGTCVHHLLHRCLFTAQAKNNPILADNVVQKTISSPISLSSHSEQGLQLIPLLE